MIPAKEQQMQRVSRKSFTFLATALSVVGLTTASAQARALHVTGQQTTITPSTQATQFLAAHHVTVSALGSATIANGALTLPIARGVLSTPKLNAIVVHKGGVKFTSGTHSFALRGFVLARVAHRTFLSARVGARRLILARVTNLTQSTSGTTALVTGDLKLSTQAARRVNRALGAHVVSGGADIGSLKSTVTVS